MTRRLYASPLSATLLAGCLLLNGCDVFQKEEEEEPEDPMIEVQTYLAAFVAEAQARGHALEARVAGLEVAFRDELVFDGSEFCGYVPLNDQGLYSNQVLFAANDACWWEQPTADREALVFHELGHAVLDRVHKNTRLPNNAWASLMATLNTGSFYAGQIANRRTYYLDELFDPSTPPPAWSQQ